MFKCKRTIMQIFELETGWNIVQEPINEWIRCLDGGQDGTFDYMRIHPTIYSMCTNKYLALHLYHKYAQTLKGYLRCKVLPAFRDKHHEFTLGEFVKGWNNHQIIVSGLSNLFMCVYRTVEHYAHLPVRSLSEVGLLCFQEVIYTRMKNSVRDAAIALIDKERDGESIDRALVKSVLDIFVAMDKERMRCYVKDFEVPLLLDTVAYYCKKGAFWIQENSCIDSYMIKVKECMEREKERVGHYLHVTSESKLLDKVKHELVFQYKKHLLENKEAGLLVFIGYDKVDELWNQLYKQCSGISTPTDLENFSTIFQQHVVQEGTLFFKQAENTVNGTKSEYELGLMQDQAFVFTLIELLEKYLRYVHVTECFYNHSMLRTALKEAFGIFCNRRVGDSTSTEALAILCDNLIKKGDSGNLNDVKDFQDTVDKVVMLLEYVCDMDLFEKFHRKNLASRLLFEECANNIEHECYMIAKVKQQYGRDFSFKMEGMVADLALIRQNQTLFEGYLNDNAHLALDVDLTVTVLTRAFWPSFKSSNLVLPLEMLECVETFNAFYQTKTAKEKLAWICSLGTCHVVGKFEQQAIELVVTTYQAALLLLFNEAERLSYRDIMNQLNLGEEDIVRLLYSLSCGKYKILIKDPNTNKVSQKDTFEFNYRFKEKLHKITLLPPVQKFDVELEKRKTIEHIDTDRRYAVDACIVRIMKRLKVVPYKQLVSECVERLNRIFKADSKFIKSRIEQLIAREFLERDHENPNVFRYLA